MCIYGNNRTYLVCLIMKDPKCSKYNPADSIFCKKPDCMIVYLPREN